MVIGIIGENCSGKSTLAKEIQRQFGFEIITGKDYLRMAKTEEDAESKFRQRLEEAVTKENIIYVISELKQMSFLPNGSVKILVSADINTIQERFKARMNGLLPEPVAQMLIRNHGMFDDKDYDFRFDGVKGDATFLYEHIRNLIQ